MASDRMFPLTLTPDRLGLMDGPSRFTWRGVLDWCLFGRYMRDGADTVRVLVQDRRSVGANIICCAGMLAWFEGLNTSNPLYWDSLRPFAELLESEQMRLCFVVFCDTESLMPNAAAQAAHWDRFLTTLGDKINVVFVGVNQPGHDGQNADPMVAHRMPNFPQLLVARDNPNESGNPTVPALDFSCYCSSRDEVKGVIEVGSSLSYVVNGWPDGGWGGTHGAVVLFEGPHFRPTGPWASPAKARQLARSLCFDGTVGGNYYCDQLSQSQTLAGVERDMAVEFCGNIPNP